MANATLGAVLRHLRAAADPAGEAAATDGQLLARFAARREEEPFALLLRRHGPMVLQVGRRVLGSEQDAEDVYQATFLLLARKAGSIRKAESVASWLHGVAHRLALKARAETVARAAHERKAGALRAADQRLPQSAWRDLQSALDEALLQVSPKHRAALTLCYLEGKSHEEAALLLGCSVGTVGSWVARGRKQLRAHLARRGIALTAGALATALAASAASAAPRASLVKATLGGGLSFAAGGVAGAVSARAVVLAEAALPAAAARLSGAVALAALLTAGVAGALAWPGAALNPARTGAAVREADPPAEAAEARGDPFGDPLPPEAVARIGSTRFRHGGHIYSLAFTHGGKRLASSGDDGLRIWDAATGREERHLSERLGFRPLRTAVSADGKYAASAGEEGARDGGPAPLVLWDLAAGKKVKELAKGTYFSERFSPRGNVLAVTRHTGMSMEWKDSWVEAWDVNTGKQLASWVAHKGDIRSLAFTGDGKVVMTAGADKTVRFWDSATGKKLRQIDGVINREGSLALSPDGKLLACIEMTDTPPMMFNGERPLHSVALRDARDGKILRRLEAPAKNDPRRVFGFFRVSFSADGKALAAGGAYIDVHVWDVATGAERCRIATVTDQAALALSPDGKAVAVATNTRAIYLHDATTGKELSRPRGLTLSPYGLQLTPDGATLLTAGGLTSYILWDPATGKERRRLEGDAGSSLAQSRLSADGRTLLSIDRDWTIRVWEVGTGKRRQMAIDPVGPYPHLLAVSPNGKAFALAGEMSVVRVLDAVTGKPTHRLEVGPARVLGAEFLADGRSLVEWSGDRKARVWDLATGKQVRHVGYVETPHRPAGSMRLPNPDRVAGVADAYYKAAVSPDGRLIAFASDYGMIALHDLIAGHELRRIEGLPTRANTMAFSPDGRTLAWGAEGDSKVRLLEVSTGKERHVFAGHAGPVVGLSFSSDGRTLASGSGDTTALVWDLTAARSAKLSAGGAEAAWKDLASTDAARAYRAVRGLAVSPQVEAFFRERVKPTPAADPKRLEKLIADLDGDTFAAREAAVKELEKLGDRAAGALRAARAAGPALEPRRRVEALLKRLANEARESGAERVRLVRALEALELCGTEGARRLLEALAKGAPGAWLTEEAKATLARLEARRGKGG